MGHSVDVPPDGGRSSGSGACQPGRTGHGAWPEARHPRRAGTRCRGPAPVG